MLVEVVIPSFEGHLLFLHDQLASWYRYCIDASHVNFTIVTSDFAETVLFRKALKRLETMLSIRVLDVWESLRAAGEHISHARLLRLIGKPSNPEERPPWPGALSLRKIDSFKHVLQSTKKLYGCLASKADWCFVTDSETLLIRCVRLAELVAHYIAKGRTILHNPRYNPPVYRPDGLQANKRVWSRFGMWQCARRTNVLLLGCDRPRIGWLMESYNWMWERPLLRMFHTFLLARNTTPVQMWERDAFGAALRPNETGREPFVSGFPDGVACRTFLAIEQTYYMFIALAANISNGSSVKQEGAAQLRDARNLARRYTFVSTAELANRLVLPFRVATANVDHGLCSFGECLSALLPQMTSYQASHVANFMRAHAIATLSPRAPRNLSCAYCTPPARELTRIESTFLNRSQVSFITSGNMHSGPMMYFARARNGLPPNQHSLAASMAVKIARSKRPARRIHTTRVFQDMLQQDVLKRC